MLYLELQVGDIPFKTEACLYLISQCNIIVTPLFVCPSVFILARLVNVSMQRTVPVKTHTARFWSIYKYRFNLAYVHNPRSTYNNNIEECLYSVRCYRSVRENAHGIVFRAVCVLPSLVTKSRPRRFATRAGLGDSCR